MTGNKPFLLVKNLILGLLFYSLSAHSQDINDGKPDFEGSAYLDIFYGYDFNKPDGKQRLPYLYHYNRHNEFNLNHGVIRVSMSHPRYRANISFQAGTYVEDNYSSESNAISHIFDANAGLALNKANNLWLDVGIFGNSWLGAESTMGINNWTASRSILSENVPYYMAGAKISYSPSAPWTFAGYLVNGWQRIQRVEGNSLPGFGTQVNFDSGDHITLNWSTFTGTDDPDSTRRIRFFNNLYLVCNLENGWGISAGGDFGIQQKEKNSSTMDNWYGLFTLVRKSWTKKWATTFRYEYYHDQNNVIVNTSNPNGYLTSGLSVNVDYRISNILLCRIEGRWFGSPDNIYPKENSWINNNFFILGTFAIDITKNTTN